MTQPARPFRLDNDPQGSGLSCDETGLRLAGVPLLREAVGGFAARAPAEIAALLACAYGDGPDAPRLSAGGLETVARALNQGDLAKAMTAAVFLRLPELDPKGAARIVHAEALLAKWDGQPHDADGRFGQGKMSNAAAHQNRPPTQSTKPSGPAPHVQGQTISHVATAADFATPKTPANAPGQCSSRRRCKASSARYGAKASQAAIPWSGAARSCRIATETSACKMSTARAAIPATSSPT